MNKVETICPYCKKTTAVVRKSFGALTGRQDVQCSHCSKSWEEDLSDSNRLAKSVHPTSLAELRVQVRAQFDELLKQINALQERRTVAIRSAKFNTSGIEKSDVAEQEIQKALADGKPLNFQTLSGTRPSGGAAASSGRFVPDGVEKSDLAGQELTKALSNG